MSDNKAGCLFTLTYKDGEIDRHYVEMQVGRLISTPLAVDGKFTVDPMTASVLGHVWGVLNSFGGNDNLTDRPAAYALITALSVASIEGRKVSVSIENLEAPKSLDGLTTTIVGPERWYCINISSSDRRDSKYFPINSLELDAIRSLKEIEIGQEQMYSNVEIMDILRNCPDNGALSSNLTFMTQSMTRKAHIFLHATRFQGIVSKVSGYPTIPVALGDESINHVFAEMGLYTNGSQYGETQLVKNLTINSLTSNTLMLSHGLANFAHAELVHAQLKKATSHNPVLLGWAKLPRKGEDNAYS